MNEIIVSGLTDSDLQRLQQRAEAHGRSLQEEARHILTRGLDALDNFGKALHEHQARTREIQVQAAKLKEDFQANMAKLKQKIIDDGIRDAEQSAEIHKELDDLMDDKDPVGIDLVDHGD